MFDQICLSPQVKPSVIISNKHGIHCCRRSCWTTFGDLLFLMELVLLLERKIYITLNLSSTSVFWLQKEKEIINTLTRALYICCFYYVEILKHAQDPINIYWLAIFPHNKGFFCFTSEHQGNGRKEGLSCRFFI